MQTLTTIPFLVCIIGVILYLATDNKPSECGRIMFAFGLLTWLIALAGKSLL